MLNRTQFNAPVVQVDAGNFGHDQRRAAARQVQIGAKFLFWTDI